MVEAVSALSGLIPAQAGGARVTATERRLGALWQVSAWPGGLGDAGRAAAAAAGAQAAPGPGRWAEGADGAMLIRTEPMRWWIAAPSAVAAPEAGGWGTVLELSHARAVLHLCGPAAPEVVARLAPVDLRPARFADGAVLATGIDGIGVTIAARAGGLDLFLPRSFAAALWERVAEAGAQFGLTAA